MFGNKTRCQLLLDILKKNLQGLTVLDMTNAPHYHTDCRKEISDLRKVLKGTKQSIADRREKRRSGGPRFKRYFYKENKHASKA